MKIRLRRVDGLDLACEAVRLSFNSSSKQERKLYATPDFWLWEDDVALMSGLIKKGDSHAKAMRMATVWMNITAPRNWWTEFDTAKVGTVRMSASTMHKLLARDVTREDFENGDALPEYYINHVNEKVKEKDLIGAKNALPESFLQESMVLLNYQVLRHMYFDRRNHKLPAWHTFLSAVSLLPFFKEFITIE